MPSASPAAREQALHLGYSEVSKEGSFFCLGILCVGEGGSAKNGKKKSTTPKTPRIHSQPPPQPPPPNPTKKNKKKGGSPPPRGEPS